LTNWRISNWQIEPSDSFSSNLFFAQSAAKNYNPKFKIFKDSISYFPISGMVNKLPNKLRRGRKTNLTRRHDQDQELKSVLRAPSPLPLLPETSTKSFLIRFNPHRSTKNNLNPRPFILIYIYFGRFPPHWRAENFKKNILSWLG